MSQRLTHYQRQVNFAVEVFSQPAQFETPKDFLAALSEVLLTMCELKGVEPEPIPDEWVNA